MTATTTTVTRRSDRPVDSTPAQSSSGRETPQFRLRRRAHRVVLIAHILASVGWFGVALAVAMAGIAAVTTGDRTLPVALYRSMETAPWLSIPLGLVAVATGIVLGLGTRYGLVRHWWVVAKIVIAVAVVVTDAVLVRAVAHDAAMSGAGSAPLYGSTIAHVVLLAVATWLSVVKPRARTPFRARHA